MGKIPTNIEKSMTQMSFYSYDDDDDDDDDDDETITTVIISFIKNADIFWCSLSRMGTWLNRFIKWWKIF